MNLSGVPVDTFILQKSCCALAILSVLAQPFSFATSTHKTESENLGRTAESNSDTSTAAVSDAFDKELDETKKQLEESAPPDSVQSILPPSGRVLTPQQKKAAGAESTQIVTQPGGDNHKIPAKHADGTPTIALALGGGGARGAAHIGVLKVLEQEGIPVDQIVGNSMGSIVGGLYSAGLSLDDISARLEDLSLRKAYMPGGIAKKIALLPLSRITHPFRPKHYAGLWSGKKFTNYLERILPRPNMNISDTKIPFSPVATNLLDGKAYRITKGPLSTAIKASAAISPLLQPVALDNKLFIDGGVRANLPAAAAKATGAGLVVAVLVDEPLQPVPAKRFMHLKNIAARVSDIMLVIADERQLQYADIVINPDISGIPILSHDPDDVRKAIEAGELAARKAMPELRRKLHLQINAEASKSSG